jgi:hypothetical protein
MTSTLAKYAFLCDWHWRQGALPAKEIEAEGFAGVNLKSSGAAPTPMAAANQFFVDPFFQQNANLLMSTGMAKLCYHYLVPGFPSAQAALLYDNLQRVGGHLGWMPNLDAEREDLSWYDISRFVQTWNALSNGYPLWVYTRKQLWLSKGWGPLPGTRLHRAFYVSQAIRDSAERPYASQHALGITSDMFTGFSSWTEADMLQFTDKALVVGKRTTSSVWQGSRADFISRARALA